jgi:hypothetical protein
MLPHSLLLQTLVPATLAERHAEAERYRLARALRLRGRSERAAVRPRDLGAWLADVSGVVARRPPGEPAEHHREALATIVRELTWAAREAGVEAGPSVDHTDPPVVLMRALGSLAARTAGRSVPVAPTRQKALAAALSALTRAGRLTAREEDRGGETRRGSTRHRDRPCTA